MPVVTTGDEKEIEQRHGVRVLLRSNGNEISIWQAISIILATKME
ncbi:hypothetical protein [Bradyrhizobium sp. JYMT SZCCT0428]|nr:hypothetical protein [Bradyrhizobium sp. JYMT SZCCT0428]